MVSWEISLTQCFVLLTQWCALVYYILAPIGSNAIDPLILFVPNSIDLTRV